MAMQWPTVACMHKVGMHGDGLTVDRCMHVHTLKRTITPPLTPSAPVTSDT
jgi:hypothetical protein